MASLKSLSVAGDSSLNGLYNTGKITSSAGFFHPTYNDNYLLTAGGGAVAKSSFLSSLKTFYYAGYDSASKSLNISYDGKTSMALTFSGSLVCSTGSYIPTGATATVNCLDVKGTDTKNTAGSTNSSVKFYLVGTYTQATSAQTYANALCFQEGNCLYSNGAKCLTSVVAGDIGYGTGINDASNNYVALKYINIGANTQVSTTDTIAKVFAEYDSKNASNIPPNHFGANRAGFIMQKTTITNTSATNVANDSNSWKNYLLVDCYAGTDVGGVTGFAMSRQAPRAWIMQTTGAKKDAWNAYAEVVTSYNINKYVNGATIYQLTKRGDNRSVATTPSDYKNVFKFEGIKTAASVGITALQTGYVSVFGTLGYTDFSAFPAYEFATGTNGFFMRKSDNTGTAWNAWQTIITSANISKYVTGGSGGSGTYYIGATKANTVSSNGTDLKGIGSVCNVAMGSGAWSIDASGNFRANSIKPNNTTTLGLLLDSSIRIAGDASVTGNAYATAFYQNSDERLKTITNEISIEDSYKLVDNIKEINFKYKSDETNTKRLGVIAQEIEEYFPEIVSKDKYGYRAVDYSKLSVICLRVIKDLKKRIETLENKK